MENGNKIDKIFDREDVELFTNIKDKLKTMSDLSELVIITDFDFTITKRYNNHHLHGLSTMGTVEFWDMLSEEFRIKRNKDFDFYAPKEYDLSLSLEDRRKYCDEWTHIGLTDLSNEKLHEKDFDLLIKDVIDNKKLILRDHVKEIFKFADDNNIPLYILSAGLGNVIEHVMKYAIPEYQSLIDKKLLVLVSNFLTFDEKTGLVNGFKKPVLNTFSKVDVRLFSYIKMQALKEAFVHLNKNALVFGDHHHDSLCVQKLNLHNNVSLAFANYNKEDMIKNNFTLYSKYKEHWDGVLFNDNDFKLHVEILNGLKNKHFN